MSLCLQCSMPPPPLLFFHPKCPPVLFCSICCRFCSGLTFQNGQETRERGKNLSLSLVRLAFPDKQFRQIREREGKSPDLQTMRDNGERERKARTSYFSLLNLQHKRIRIVVMDCVPQLPTPKIREKYPEKPLGCKQGRKLWGREGSLLPPLDLTDVTNQSKKK